MKASVWKIISLTPLLLLCLLLLVNGCTRKELPSDTHDPELEELQNKEKERQKKEQEEENAGNKDKEQERGKKPTRKSKKKLPPTQRPYVIDGETYHPISSAEGYEETGIASWYGDPFHGRKTANGETYDMYGVTAAHKTLPMDTMLLVKNLVNGKTATVRVNDRGPFVDGRIIDLSYTTAKELGIVQGGTGKVEIIALCAAEEQDYDRDILVAQPNKKDKEEKKEAGEIPVLVAQSKKKTSKAEEELKKPEQVTGAMCAVIRPNGKKQRIQHDFDKGNFYIQVGSFKDRGRARELARTFAAKGRNVVIQRFAAAGTSLFRVLIYSSTSLKEAKAHKEKLAKQGYDHAFVIARDAPSKKLKELGEKIAVK